MPSIETSVWLALKGRVQSLNLPGYTAVAWPNEAFTKPATGGYLRVTWVPNTNRRRFIGSAAPHERLGLLQIDVFAPKNQNAAVGIEIAGKVAAHFPADLRLINEGITLRVIKVPDVAQPIPDDTHLMVPVTISYRCFI